MRTLIVRSEKSDTLPEKKTVNSSLINLESEHKGSFCKTGTKHPSNLAFVDWNTHVTYVQRHPVFLLWDASGGVYSRHTISCLLSILIQRLRLFLIIRINLFARQSNESLICNNGEITWHVWLSRYTITSILRIWNPRALNLFYNYAAGCTKGGELPSVAIPVGMQSMTCTIPLWIVCICASVVRSLKYWSYSSAVILPGYGGYSTICVSFSWDYVSDCSFNPSSCIFLFSWKRQRDRGLS